MPDTVHNPPGVMHTFANTWGQVLLFLFVQVGGLVWFLASVKDGQDQFRYSINALSTNVERMSDQVSRLAQANERIDEHIRGMDRRLDVLEKDSQVKEWRQKP